MIHWHKELNQGVVLRTEIKDWIERKWLKDWMNRSKEKIYFFEMLKLSSLAWTLQRLTISQVLKFHVTAI
jgi:hypothetical protein